MDAKHKRLVRKLITVVFLTVVMVVCLVAIRNYVNRREAMRSMGLIGQYALEYRSRYGSLPPESHINQIQERIQAVRIGSMNYRAVWIHYGAEPNSTPLAYIPKPSVKHTNLYKTMIYAHCFLAISSILVIM